MAGRSTNPVLRHRRLALGAAALVLAVAVGAIVVGGSPSPTGQADPSTRGSTGTGGTPTDGPGSVVTGKPYPRPPSVLMAGFSIRAGTPPAHAAPGTRVVSGKPLPPNAIAQILDRLPAWSGAAGLATDYRWPAQSLTKPPAGTTVHQTFPGPGDSQNPPTTPPPTPTGPLHVLRMQPQGDVAVAPFVSITFDQPMVPVSTVGQQSAAAVPARISPAVPGHWDWIGTSTLRFTAESTEVDRLPMATRFTVTVPAGTTSQTGGRLAATATATFSTPPPAVQSFTPGPDSPVGLHPVAVAVFDQRVDTASVLQHLTVTAGGTPWPVRAATPKEIAADRLAAAAMSAAPDGRAVAFRPERDFPAATDIVVTVGSGTPSAEGPLRSPQDNQHRFSTYPPMQLQGGGCGASDCQPGGPILLRFSNPVDADAFDPASVSVTPAIPGGASITAGGDEIIIAGATQPMTRYHVVVAAGLKDTFGQTLAEDAELTASFGHANTALYPFPTPVTTLDPLASTPTVTVTTVNQKRFRERVFAVDLTDWETYRGWYAGLLSDRYTPGTDLHVPAWPVLVDRTVAVDRGDDRLVATALDLAPQLTDGRSQVVVLIEPIDPAPRDQEWQNRPTVTWAQSTTLAVDAVADRTTVHAWVTDLRTGAPVPGVTVRMLDGSGDPVQPGTVTDAQGLGTLKLTASGGYALLAGNGDQTALLPADMWGSAWRSQPQHDRLLWYVTDDRQTYRPGETVSVKGWVRRQADDTTLALSTPAAGTVYWTATDNYGSKLGSGQAGIDSAGGFDLALSIPAGAHLGVAFLHLQTSGGDTDYSNGNDHPFTIADFRTPAFEVQTHSGTGDPAVRGSDLPVQVDAGYYAGGPVGDAPVAWQVQTAKASYSPPGWSDYTFGVWVPWWYDGPVAGGGMASGPAPCCGPRPGGGSDSTVQTFNGTTDGNGSDYLDVQVGDLGGDTDGLPVTVVAQATVTDVNRQQIADTADILVHPADYYVGLASNATFIKQGQQLTVQAIVTGIDGTAAAGRPVTVTAGRVTDQWSAGSTGQTVADPKTCSVTSQATPVSCTFTPALGGQYRITAIVTDEQGRTSRTELTRWVAGPDGSVATTVQQQSLTVVPDRKVYQPGQSARLLVASPITTGTGLVTVTHNGIVSTQTFPVADGSAVVSIPLSEDSMPGVTAVIEVVGTVPRSGDPAGGEGRRVAYAAGQIDLAVSTASRSLTVDVSPRDSTVKPGGSTTVDVTVTDPAGQPVPGSQFEIVVVDEAVLALSGYQLPDPLAAFYPDNQPNWVQAVYGRATVMLGATPAGAGGEEKGAASSAAAGPAAGASGSSAGAADSAAGAPAAPVPGSREMAGGAVKQPATTPIQQRSDFSALALFRPTVTTGADGTASIPVTLPDNLTRYRVMVVAVAGDTRFGTGESTITAGLPLTVRPTPPRFLNFGDRAELPVIVQNRTGSELTADVVLQAANLTVAGATAGTTGKRITVPANSRVEVRFDVAADRAGTARFRVAVVGGDDADAAQQQIPVYTPSTSETFATYGSIEGGSVISQQLSKPDGVIPAFGGLQISTSSTALAQLTDAVHFVADYDYRSSDALACQVMAISSLGDVLQAFSAPGLQSPAQLKSLVATDLRALAAMQNEDGGFPYWQRGDKSDPFNSVQVVQSLLIAEKYGYGSSQEAVTRALPYLRDIDAKLPAGVSVQTRQVMNAYALAVRALAGDSGVTSAADRMVTGDEATLPMDAVAWLLPLVSAPQRQTLLTRVRNAAVDNAGSATFTTAVTDDTWTTLQSDARTDALILDALLSVDPQSDLITKVVNGLMGLQRGGRWDNMQANGFTLVALRHYYDVYESATPDLVAAVWLGDRFAGQHQYSGHTTEQTAMSIPTAELLKQGDTAITVADNGSGRLYYRIGLTTAPASLSVPALDRGFVVARSYRGADDPFDVTQDSSGVWHIKAGARVRVTVTLVSRSAQSHVALTDPLPAGLEPLNPELATTPKDLAGREGADDGARPLMWSPTWYDHQDLRDDRAEAFAGWLQGGVYTYSYLASATTPGTFVVPPATAKQIYAPETFGRTATATVVVQG
ncbi:MAG TPA: alpha-2-macroglobulin family protein [Nakamurella sp.]|nr:alpha-2-macroglobulin family protein [Nakamurella sp.]